MLAGAVLTNAKLPEVLPSTLGTKMQRQRQKVSASLDSDNPDTHAVHLQAPTKGPAPRHKETQTMLVKWRQQRDRPPYLIGKVADF
jgi:hypothetical protein